MTIEKSESLMTERVKQLVLQIGFIKLYVVCVKGYLIHVSCPFGGVSKMANIAYMLLTQTPFSLLVKCPGGQ